MVPKLDRVEQSQRGTQVRRRIIVYVLIRSYLRGHYSMFGRISESFADSSAPVVVHNLFAW